MLSETLFILILVGLYFRTKMKMVDSFNIFEQHPVQRNLLYETFC